LECAACYHVGAGVPADVVNGVKCVGYLRNGCGEDCAVLVMGVSINYVLEECGSKCTRETRNKERYSDIMTTTTFRAGG